jgi:hypothetical protein
VRTLEKKVTVDLLSYGKLRKEPYPLMLVLFAFSTRSLAASPKVAATDSPGCEGSIFGFYGIANSTQFTMRKPPEGGRDRLSTTFAALADPTRRAILARLLLGECSVGVEPFEMSMPAVSKHLRVLERAGLIP